MLKIVKRVSEEDRISELPVHIIHHILCHTDLDLQEAARSCILSKRWYYCWTSRPNLIFGRFQGKKIMPLENYVKLVDQSLRSYVEQNLHLEQLNLTYRDPELDSHVDTWIELAVKLNVRVLGIYASFLRSYSLPDVINDAKKLTKLRLKTCKFEFDISTTHIRFDCLEDLYLDHVHISDAQWQRIIERSPFIRTLTLYACQGIKKLQVCGLVHLENLIVEWCKFDSVIVQVPNLQCFKYEEHAVYPCKIVILDGYNTLQTLELMGASITEQQFRDVSYKFPNISELNLTLCIQLKNIEIQSEKLKKFTLVQMESLEKVTIQAPNLLEFDFKGDKVPFSSMDPSSLERSQLNFISLSTNFGSVDSSWYTNLHHFVQKFNYSKGLILAIFCRKVLSILKECTQKQNCGRECPFNTEYFHRHSILKDVISCPYCPCTGVTEEGMTSIWYSWLKSTPLTVTNFMLK
ncbi:hypothetical protein H5410_062569, partial [Solanum commersonii]